MARTEASVEAVICETNRAELSLPEMQRRDVWRSSRLRDLVDRPDLDDDSQLSEPLQNRLAAGYGKRGEV